MSRTVIATVAVVSTAFGGAESDRSVPVKGIDEGLSTISIAGEEYGAEDGVSVEIERIPVEPGGEPIEKFYVGGAGEISPLARWGSSYAISTETLDVYFEGRAQAAGNIYYGERIVGVCFWYSRGGERLTSENCSSARSSGSSWSAGAEVTDGVWESRDWGAPDTIFNIRTTRIDPGIH